MKRKSGPVGKRGIALVHVLVLSIFVIAITLGLSLMLLQRYTQSSRRAESNTKTAIGAGTAARLNTGWNANSQFSSIPMHAYCSSFTDSQGTCSCSLAGCNCTCTCTVTGDASQTTTAAGSCAVTNPFCDQCSISVQTQ